jgi:tRNA(Ile)-lysidine synthase
VSRGPPGSTEQPLAQSDFAAAFAGLEVASHLLVAVSGGPDSTALLGGLAAWAPASRRPCITIATVDHGLRPESRAEAESVAAFTRSLGLPHAILTWAGRKGRNVSQEAARRARYGLLVAHAREISATHLLTAHTLDDQAETLMLRLAAGSGLSGLAGMRREVARGGMRHVRPLLDFPKSRLVATCRARGWSFIDDPYNEEMRFARVRWRRTLMPLLAAEGLDAGRLARLAERMARAEEALDRTAQITFARVAGRSGAGIVLDLRRLAAEPADIILRVLKRALSAVSCGGDAPQLRLERLEDCMDALLQGLGSGTAVRRTLAGCRVRLHASGSLTISPEGVRHRGRREALTPIDNPVLPSLGRDPRRA